MLGAGRQGPVEYRCCAVRCAWATSWSKKRTSRTLPVADLRTTKQGQHVRPPLGVIRSLKGSQEAEKLGTAADFGSLCCLKQVVPMES
eukprot:1158106-Pelagomonas_calceolata.AAC.8